MTEKCVKCVLDLVLLRKFKLGAISIVYAVRNCNFWLHALMNGKERVEAVLGNSSAYDAHFLLQNTNSLICIYFN